MATDEELARRLQAEEFAMALPHQRTANAGDARLRGALDNIAHFSKQAEDEFAQALAMSLMPWDEMQERARRTHALNQADGPAAGPQLGVQDYAMIELLGWFKNTFQWVDSPKCLVCAKPTQAVGVVAPSPEEAEHQATRTEAYMCVHCQVPARFPRYNSVTKLLETQCGRCGEWANAFLLFCRAAGFNARYVWDINDHVWTEFWSDALGRWVHVDSCEAAFDKPLLYEAGWGKKMEYVLAGNTTGVADVTLRYTGKWKEVLARRTLMTEQQLAALVQARNTQLRALLAPAALHECAKQDLSEERELSASRTGVVANDRLEGLGARTTGSEAWRRERGEDGAQNGAAAPASQQAQTAPLLQPATPWYALPQRLWTPPDMPQLPTQTAIPIQGPAAQATTAKGPASTAQSGLFECVGRLQGGGCRASGENGRHEGCVSVFDGDVSTKWLDFGGAGVGGNAWLEYRLEPGQDPVVLASYDLVSANDSPERNPCDWVLEGLTSDSAVHANGSSDKAQQGSAAGSQGGWVTLDTQTGVTFDRPYQLRRFWVAMVVPCRAFRLRITKLYSPAIANSVQLACWNLYQSTPAWTAQDRTAAGSREAAARAAVAAKQDTPALQLSILTKLLSNIATNPTDNKFRYMRARKLVALWSDPKSLTVLLAVGFRPIITWGVFDGSWTDTPTRSEGDRDLWLVCEAGNEAAERAKAAHAALV